MIAWSWRIASVGLIATGCAEASDRQAASPCFTDADCSRGVCQPSFEDKDRDGYGDPGTRVDLCLEVAETLLREDDSVLVVNNGDDCCDTDVLVNPGQTQFFNGPQTSCRDVKPFDYNCDGDETSDHLAPGTECSAIGDDQCETRRGWAGAAGDPEPPCGGIQVAGSCVLVGASCEVDVERNRYDQNLCR